MSDSPKRQKKLSARFTGCDMKECVRFSLLVCLLFLACIIMSMGVVLLGRHILIDIGWVSETNAVSTTVKNVNHMFISGIIATVFCVPVLLVLTTPLRRLSEASEKVAKGDFSVRVRPTKVPIVKSLCEKFNDMVAEIDKVEMLRDDFINNFSHEFKTPIVSMQGFARLLKNSDLTEEERTEYLDIIITESDRLGQLATNVLQLSRLEQLNKLTDVTSFNVTEQVRLAVVLLEPKWSAKQINLDLDADELTIEGSRQLLSHVWINLLDNAIKFTDDFSTITISLSLSENGKWFYYRITDQGHGMTEEEQKHIFEKFYQGETSHKTVGNGIGLCIVGRVAQLHHGKVYLEKTSDEGSTFTLKIPVRYR